MSDRTSIPLSEYALPPNSKDDTVYGYLYVELGNLTWSKGHHTPYNKIKVKFWGESGLNCQILRPVNNASKEIRGIPTSISYQIRCSLLSFYKYLQDGRDLRFYILDPRNDKPLGNAILKLPLYLKHKYN